MKYLVAALATTLASGSIAEASGLVRPARLTFTVPVDAQVSLNERLMKSTGTTRVYQTPPLRTDTFYFYDIAVTVTRDGRDFHRRERIVVWGGDNLKLSYFDLLNDVEGAAYPQAPAMVEELCAQERRKAAEVFASVARDRDMRAGLVSTMSASDLATLDERDEILKAAAQSPLELRLNAVSDVRFTRMNEEELKVTLEVANGGLSRRVFSGSVTELSIERYHLLYRKARGGWALQRYWSLGGKTVGEVAARWHVPSSSRLDTVRADADRLGPISATLVSGR